VGGAALLAVKDRFLCFLFENKGDVYIGRGFEMLAVLSQHFPPNLVSNAFTFLMTIFNDVQGQDEPIIHYWCHFDGLIMELSCCKVTIPQVLMVMLFLQAVHGHYLELLDQFCTHFKYIEMATINPVVEDIAYHDSFTVHERKGSGKPATSTPCIPAAASVNTDQKGTVWQNPFEWISTSYSKKAIKTRWTHTIAGTGICSICHCADKPWHVPCLCLLLKELNLKLGVLPPGSPAPAPGPSPTSCMVTADESVPGSSLVSGSAPAPSGLMALTSCNLPGVPKEYNSKDDFCWDGNKYGVEFGAS
jgi:hypothetical protein